MAAVFVAATAAILVLTVRLPHILSRRPPTLSLLWPALAMFSLAVVIGAIFFWFVVDRFKETAHEHRRVQGIVRSATGATAPPPDWLSRLEPWRLVALLLALPVIALLVYILAHRLFPNAPSWTPVAVIWIAGAILVLLNYRKLRRSANSSLRRPSLWRTLLNFTLWFAVLMFAMRFDPRWLSPYFSPKAVLVLLTLLCLALPLIVWLLGFLPWCWIGRALARADYETALRRADLLLRISPNDAGFRFVRGTVLLFAGRYPEAEQALRESAEVADASATASQSVTLANLGETQMLQGRYEEAIRNYEAAAQIHAGWGRAYSGMAETCLWRDIEPERALTLLDRALTRKLRTWMSRHFDRHVLAQMYADRAWALALLGRTEEFRVDLEKAFRAARRSFRPGLASVHYRAGRAFLAVHDARQADEHFRRAQQLDTGSSGMQAAQMLRRSG